MNICFPHRGSTQRKRTRAGSLRNLRISGGCLGKSCSCEHPRKTQEKPSTKPRKNVAKPIKHTDKPTTYFSLFSTVFLCVDPRVSSLTQIFLWQHIPSSGNSIRLPEHSSEIIPISNHHHYCWTDLHATDRLAVTHGSTRGSTYESISTLTYKR